MNQAEFSCPFYPVILSKYGSALFPYRICENVDYTPSQNGGDVFTAEPAENAETVLGGHSPQSSRRSRR